MYQRLIFPYRCSASSSNPSGSQLRFVTVHFTCLVQQTRWTNLRWRATLVDLADLLPAQPFAPPRATLTSRFAFENQQSTSKIIFIRHFPTNNTNSQYVAKQYFMFPHLLSSSRSYHFGKRYPVVTMQSASL